MKTVAVGMSGGVDSAMAALLLRKAGYEVIGLSMVVRRQDAAHVITACCRNSEAEIKALAARLGILHYSIPVAEEYARLVLRRTREQYLAGLTPNPCAVCNPELKFWVLLEKAKAAGIKFDFFATGHYARLTADPASWRMRLFMAADKTKDQSYFLARLSQAQLRQTIFPLGEMTKTDVKRLARKSGFEALAERPESQDFFEPAVRTAFFNASELVPGPILDLTGKKVGEHRGIALYTVGQREGLGLALGARMYVKEIRAEENAIVVADRREIVSRACNVCDVSWIHDRPPAPAETLTVRPRYRHPGAAAAIALLNEAGTRLRIAFDEPQFAIAPGQMAVFYRGEEVLGGGWIEPEHAENRA